MSFPSLHWECPIRTLREGGPGLILPAHLRVFLSMGQKQTSVRRSPVSADEGQYLQPSRDGVIVSKPGKTHRPGRKPILPGGPLPFVVGVRSLKTGGDHQNRWKSAMKTVDRDVIFLWFRDSGKAGGRSIVPRNQFFFVAGPNNAINAGETIGVRFSRWDSASLLFQRG